MGKRGTHIPQHSPPTSNKQNLIPSCPLLLMEISPSLSTSFSKKLVTLFAPTDPNQRFPTQVRNRVCMWDSKKKQWLKCRTSTTKNTKRRKRSLSGLIFWGCELRRYKRRRRRGWKKSFSNLRMTTCRSLMCKRVFTTRTRILNLRRWAID